MKGQSSGWFATVMAVALCVTPPAGLAQQRVADDARAEANARASEVLARPVTVDVNRASLQDAIETVAASASVRVQYRARLLASYKTPITLHAAKMPLGAALGRVLEGTGLRAVAVAGDIVNIERDVNVAQSGIITGSVVDAATKRSLRGVTLVVDGTKLTATTGDDGTFKIVGVPAGSHRVIVRRLGYQAYTTTITVADDATATITVALSTTATRLTEVVTTAIGNQRRLEVGNVISHLNVDSIAPTAAVSSLTDLLSARAPNVQIVASSGLVGSGPSIRIRGQSSLLLANDPILIVDGIRQDNTPGGRYSNVSGTVTTPSRINDLDFNQIESIDILKGPAASTEYGTDAANGVIVITTKRGKAGKPQWNLSADRGWSNIATGFPDLWWAYGHTNDASQDAVQCTLPDRAAGACVVDSVQHDNPLNHKQTSSFAPGLNESADLSVGGGSETVRYYLGTGASRQFGTTRMPPVFRPIAKTLGLSLPSNDPNVQSQRSARANVSAHLGPNADLTMSGSYGTTVASIPAGDGLVFNRSYGPVIVDSAHYWGYGDGFSTPILTLGMGLNEATTTATASVSADWRPFSWFNGHFAGGTSRGSQHTQSIWPPKVAQYAEDYPRATGTLQISDVTTSIGSGDVRGSVSALLTEAVRSATSLGLQIAQTTQTGLSAINYNMTAANPTLNGTPGTQTVQVGDGHSTVGGYVEEQLNVRERLFLTGAMRFDGASGFGSDYNVTAYPKLSASWLAYQGGDKTLRLRAAFGTAGVQPDNGSALQLYQAQTVWMNGSQVTGIGLKAPGNPDLRPEKSQEFEAGLDLGMWDNRLNLELSAYNKRTKDALIQSDLGLTFTIQYSGLQWQQNLGDIRNSGVEGSLNVALLQTEQTTWSMTVNASHNSNKLLRLAPGVTQRDMGSSFAAVGYPINGRWGKRVTFQDTNGDGFITADEVTIADSNQFLGSSLPTVEASMAHQISLFRGLVSLNTLFDLRTGDIIDNPLNPYDPSSQVMNDTTVSLYDQARLMARQRTYYPTTLDYVSGWLVSWRELSMSLKVPTQWLHGVRTRDVSITTAVRDLGKWTHYKGLDPEVREPNYGYNQLTGVGHSGGDLRTIGARSVPLPRTWTLRVNVGL